MRIKHNGAATLVAEKFGDKDLYATEVASPEIELQGAVTLVSEDIEIKKNLLRAWV